MISSKRTKTKPTLKRKRIKLRYLLDVVAGYGRVRCGRGFYYTDVAGNRVADAAKLARFRALVIPPGWKEVWINPSKKGHLQATGIDEEGRKQYLYHPEWTSERQAKKLTRIAAFGKVLPRLRRRIATDMRCKVLTKEKVTAIALKTTEETLIRIGNDQYLRRYGSHGLTTLKKKHVRITAGESVFRFKGKKGVRQEIKIRSSRLASHLEALARLKGAYLFQYVEESDGSPCRLRSQDVNTYIQAHAGVSFSSKDYRTWYASFWAFRFFAHCSAYASEQECQANIVSVLDKVSQRLGNTRTVCKQYYVPDSIVQAYKNGTLTEYLATLRNGERMLTKKETEKGLLAFLEHAATKPST
ncbi:DNA topoisomerase IB [Parapedobacter sp. 10938]|uniref:DNA topoisomerase IB n=1 Tax=Parapedobacter flavus TaxID=3110225 RepID=UPI002DB6A2A9|nr:DNA topoisomerase IB [Parapedobacter sp. 10938]MEC3878674.1 DNA topoisomerase IB [Parapedobacter sp. 10938]